MRGPLVRKVNLRAIRREKNNLHPMVKQVLDLLEERFPDKRARNRLKKLAAEQKQFGRVDAIARDILPMFSPDELRRLCRHIRKELATHPVVPKPPHRPKRSKEDREKDERFAYELHTNLTKIPGWTSRDAYELVGLTMYADKRTAQYYRKAYADKLRNTRDKKPQRK